MAIELRRLIVFFAAALAAAGLASLAGCGGDDDPTGVAKSGTCIGCHSDAGALQATALPDPPPPTGDPGEG